MHRSLCRLINMVVYGVLVSGIILPMSATGEEVRGSSGAFRDLSAIESTFLRGATSKAEVRTRLGIPNGSGVSQFASLGGDKREIWYYEDISVTGVRSGDKVVQIDLRQQIVLIFFKGDRVDGYLWTSNSGPASAY